MNGFVVKILSFIIAVGIFMGWMSLVGSSHVFETIIGLVIAAGSGYWINKKLNRS